MTNNAGVRGRPIAPLVLRAQERAYLERQVRRRPAEFLNFLKEVDAQVPAGLDIHIVMDNYATHMTPKIKAWLARRPHYHVHLTPTSASGRTLVR
jgi:hypothetical protein